MGREDVLLRLLRAEFARGQLPSQGFLLAVVTSDMLRQVVRTHETTLTHGAAELFRFSSSIK